MMKTLRFFPVYIVLISLFQPAWSQSNDTLAKNSLVKHKFALQYETGYDFTSRSMDAITFLLKYHLTEKSALRFSFGINGGMGSHSSHHHYYGEMPRYNYYSSAKEQYAFVLSYLFYPSPKSDINLFIGGGPRYAFSNDHYGKPYPYGADSLNYMKNGNGDLWSLGITGILGAEWFASRSISFFTEYNASFVYQNRDEFTGEKPPPPNPSMPPPHETEETSDFRFVDLSVRLGLSLYFDSPF